VAKEAGIGHLVLSHFYPIADRYDVKAQAEEQYGGKILKGKDLLMIRI
jgi:ribonuclease BN (tRNA processing enzyme)